MSADNPYPAPYIQLFQRTSQLPSRHLRVFLTVCKQGSITKAAEELHTVQPSVSLTISELEKHYGIVLFDRRSRRLEIRTYLKGISVHTICPSPDGFLVGTSDGVYTYPADWACGSTWENNSYWDFTDANNMHEGADWMKDIE